MVKQAQPRTEIAITCVIDAAPAQVYYAFTNATALREWLCDTATVESRENGTLLLSWNIGLHAVGVYQTLRPGELVRFTWQGRTDPGETWVEIRLEAEGDGTHLTLTHGGIGQGEAWEPIPRQFAESWEAGLENLRSVLETGVDLRQARRPMVGIMPDELTPEHATKLGLPITEGLYLGGVVQGMGAEAAGLRSGDVIVSLDGRPVKDYASLAVALDSRRAGDQVAVEFYRGVEKHAVTMTLSPRQQPEVPPTPGGMAEWLRQLHAELDADLDTLLGGVTEAEANHHPAPNEWNVKEVLAHLIASERYMQVWLWNLVGGNDNVPWADNNPTHLLMALAVYPTLAELVGELNRTEAATAGMVAGLPETFLARKASYRRLGTALIGMGDHTRGHLQQMREAIEAARSA